MDALPVSLWLREREEEEVGGGGKKRVERGKRDFHEPESFG